MLVASMLIFGTIGIFRKYIPLPSGMIAMVRGIVGTMFLMLVMMVGKKKPDFMAIKKNLLLLCLSGALIGFNWILLFEAYQHTSVAVATLCYYMAPVFVILASPIVLKERLTQRKMLCAVVAFVGMVLVSGVLSSGFSGMRGILLGLGAAALYASVIMLNKKLGEIGAYDKTLVQLASAAIVLLPYVLIAENPAEMEFSALTVVMLMIVGVVHTGAAYAMYFGSMGGLKAQTVALFSYIDPAAAVVLSAVILGEKIDAAGIIGAVLVLGAAVVSDLPEKNITEKTDM